VRQQERRRREKRQTKGRSVSGSKHGQVVASAIDAWLNVGTSEVPDEVVTDITNKLRA
jgi:hypothetical protein